MLPTRLVRDNPWIQILSLLLIGAGILGLILASRLENKPHPFLPTTEEPQNTLPKGYNNGVWIWQSPHKIKQEDLDELLAFAKEKNIKVIYFYIEDYISLKEGKDKDNPEKIAAYNTDVRTAIAKANKQGIEVHALAGDSTWADPDYSYLAPMVLDYVLAFNATPNQTEKFSGVQFDIEFYNKDNYKDDRSATITHYLDLVKKLSDRVKQESNGSLTLGFAVPYWFDSGKNNAPKITYSKKNQTIMEHLLNILHDTNSYLALMAYRDHAEGKNGAIEHTKNDLALADKQTGKVKLYVGLETEKNEKGVTFYKEDIKDFYTATEQISQAFSNSKSFGGIAVHTLPGYKKLNDR
jgi:hypothetical protein